MTKLKVYDQRMQICRACPELQVKMFGSFCKVCGCNAKAKAKIQGQSCPLGKW